VHILGFELGVYDKNGFFESCIIQAHTLDIKASLRASAGLMPAALTRLPPAWF
jgi:hypothetical protein